MSVREAALIEARRWIGTPYRHQASVCGAGADCLGLIRGVWRALHGAEPQALPPYPARWDAGGDDLLLQAAGRWLIPVTEALPGDVILFRLKPGLPARHCGILSTCDTLIHAYWGRAVSETALTQWWRRRIAGVFQFPSQVK
ncbi:NlpC/P60 family protein [Hyphobacterium sp. SN044]|uniref:NlpC/P60 family protein n=1 Tax=Hyphobacterium sp. SN044 TaxID=2912575 RepID=UPI001F38F57B|nr:NlpC/P60 family protein [Hyphobacterium sp. SN044]